MAAQGYSRHTQPFANNVEPKKCTVSNTGKLVRVLYICMAAGGDDDDEEEDDEEADAEDAMYQLLFNKVMSQFKSTHGRDPTEEELKTIFMALNQRTAEAAKAADDGSERESEGDDDDGDSGAAAAAGAGAGSSSSSSSSSATSAPVPRSSPGVKRTETDSPSKDEGDNQQEQDGERANKRARS